MTDDPELQAMSTLREVLEPLSPDETKRVLSWAADRFSVTLSAQVEDGSNIPKAGVDENDESQKQRYDDFAELYYEADPDTHQERVLLGGYWFQEVLGQNELTARAINKELKHLGRKVPNITRSFRRLENKDPALAMQVRKTGQSQQARKIYRLTKPGVHYIQEMLAER